MPLSNNDDLFIPVQRKPQITTAVSTSAGTLTRDTSGQRQPERITSVHTGDSASLLNRDGTPRFRLTKRIWPPELKSRSESSHITSKPVDERSAPTTTLKGPTVSRDNRPVAFVTSSSPTPSLEIHHFTICQHTSPPANRPLDTQPDFNLTQMKSTLGGRCHPCDTAYRRAEETSILLEYNSAIAGRARTLESLRRKARSGPDTWAVVGNLEAEVNAMTERREQEVKAVWKGYSARWGPGTIGTESRGGRMKLEWIRPETKK